MLAAGCGTPRGPSKAQLKEGAAVLQRAGADADPGLVAAREIAFARTAREIGQWAAYNEFAAPGALLETDRGLVALAELATEPGTGPGPLSEPMIWAPTEVWSSCDGSLAVSLARYTRAGVVGSLVTVWTRAAGEPYRWTYRAALPDNPQPAPGARPGREGQDVIVVDALNMINARTADCPRTDEPPPPPPPEIPADLAQAPGARVSQTRAADWTLQYFWHHDPEGQRQVVVEYLRGGAWQQALALALPPGA